MSTCNCTGIRSCLVCQKENKEEENLNTSSLMFWFCPSCQQIYEGCIQLPLRNAAAAECPLNWCSFHTNCSPSRMLLRGIKVMQGFVNEEEESSLIEGIDGEQWKMSQSGRRKQDFGPKANFKRKKVKLGGFNGFPSYSKYLLDRLSTVVCLSDFSPVELCNLEYTCERGSSIDAHIDDVWLWGEELVTLNLLDTTILTLSKSNCNKDAQLEEVQIPLERRSLLVLSDEARYSWLHAIKRKDITGRRVAMTFRNLSDEILNDDNNFLIVKELQDISQCFTGTVVL